MSVELNRLRYHSDSQEKYEKRPGGKLSRNCNFDVDIIVGEMTFHTHKNLLKKHSKYFRRKLDGQHGYKIVETLHDLNEVGVDFCIEYMHSEEIRIDQSRSEENFFVLTKTLQAAKFLEMNELQNQCEKKLCSTANSRSALELVEVFRKYASKESTKWAQDFVKKNIDEIVQQEQCLDIDETDFYYYIEFSPAKPAIVWKAIKLWIRHRKPLKTKIQLALDILLAMRDVIIIVPEILRYCIFENMQDYTHSLLQKLELDEDQIVERLGPELSIQLLNFARLEGFPARGKKKIVASAIQCLAKSLKASAVDYGELDFIDFHEILTNANDHVTNEEKWKAIVLWVKHDKSHEAHALDLIKTMNLQNLDRRFISQHMRGEEFVNCSMNCLHFLLDLSLSGTLAVDQQKDKAARYKLAMLDNGRTELIVWNIQEKTTARMKLPEIKFSNTAPPARIASVQGALFLQYGRHILELKKDGSWMKACYDETYKSIWVHPGRSRTRYPWLQFVSFMDKLAVITRGHTILYEPTTNEAKRVTGCELGHGFSSTGSSACLYAVGGSDTSSAARKYTDADGWFDLPPMPISVTFPGSACFEEKLYVMGGFGLFYYQNAVVCFDGVKWNGIKPMLKARSGCAAVVYRDRLYVVGGANGYFEFVEEYGKESADWKKGWQVKATKGVVSLAVCNLSPSHYHFLP